jgi:hypothetical protein
MTIQDSLLTIMIGYGSGRPGFILDRNSVFSLVNTSKPTLGPGQPPTGLQWPPEALPEAAQLLEQESDYSPLSSAGIKIV